MFVLIGLTNLKENLNEDRAKQEKNIKTLEQSGGWRIFSFIFARSHCTGLQIAREGFETEHSYLGKEKFVFKGEIISLT